MIELTFTALSAALNNANWQVKARQPAGARDPRFYGSNPDLPGRAPNELALHFEHARVNALKADATVSAVLIVRDRQDLKFAPAHAIALVPDKDQAELVAAEKHENMQFLYVLATDTEFVPGTKVRVTIDLKAVV